MRPLSSLFKPFTFIRSQSGVWILYLTYYLNQNYFNPNGVQARRIRHIHERPFTLFTDNLPMKNLFNEIQGIPQHASSTIQRWALKLASYEYTICFPPTHKHGNADTLSRFSIKDPEGKDEDLPIELVLLMEAMNQISIIAENIQKWTQSDELLSHVYRYTQKGVPTDIPETLKMYSSRQTDLSTLNGCLLWNNRIVIPECGRRELLNKLYQAHIGMAKMKSLAHMYLWWPKSMTILRKL